MNHACAAKRRGDEQRLRTQHKLFGAAKRVCYAAFTATEDLFVAPRPGTFRSMSGTTQVAPASSTAATKRSRRAGGGRAGGGGVHTCKGTAMYGETIARLAAVCSVMCKSHGRREGSGDWGVFRMDSGGNCGGSIGWEAP